MLRSLNVFSQSSSSNLFAATLASVVFELFKMIVLKNLKRKTKMFICQLFFFMYVFIQKNPHRIKADKMHLRLCEKQLLTLKSVCIQL